MTKLDKIIDAGFHADDFVTFEPKQLKRTIQKYAEYYAKLCLAIAAENAKIVRVLNKEAMPFDGKYRSEQEGVLAISIKSITNIKLPEHD